MSIINTNNDEERLKIKIGEVSVAARVLFFAIEDLRGKNLKWKKDSYEFFLGEEDSPFKFWCDVIEVDYIKFRSRLFNLEKICI